MRTIRKGANYYSWTPEPTAWEQMTAEEKLLDIEKVLRWLAHGLTERHPERLDDVFQEGWLWAWRELKKDRDLIRQFVVHRAKMRMHAFASNNRRMTGSEMDHTHWRPPTVAMPEDENGASLLDNLLEDIRAAQHLEQVEMAQIEREIHRAVRALDKEEDRELVYLMFWEELNFKEAGKVLNIKQSTATTRFAVRIRPALCLRLEHLKPEGLVTKQRHRWTEDDDRELTILHGQGLSFVQIGKRMNLSNATLSRHAQRLGLPARDSWHKHRERAAA